MGNVIEEAITAALEGLRPHMTEGWPDLGIPPLDPLDIGELPVHVNSSDAR